MAETPLLPLGGVFGNQNALTKEHSEKASLPMLVNPAPNTADLSEEQLAKAEEPIEVTDFGIFKFKRLLQPLKAESPIEIMEFGIVTEVKPLQP